MGLIPGGVLEGHFQGVSYIERNSRQLLSGLKWLRKQYQLFVLTSTV